MPCTCIVLPGATASNLSVTCKYDKIMPLRNLSLFVYCIVIFMSAKLHLSNSSEAVKPHVVLCCVHKKCHIICKVTVFVPQNNKFSKEHNKVFVSKL
jgi:hypothetical protein